MRAMSNKSLAAIIFSILFLAVLAGYYFMHEERFSGGGMAAPDISPPLLSAEEMNRILPTLAARYKDNLTVQQRIRILNSLSAPK